MTATAECPIPTNSDEIYLVKQVKQRTNIAECQQQLILTNIDPNIEHEGTDI